MVGPRPVSRLPFQTSYHIHDSYSLQITQIVKQNPASLTHTKTNVPRPESDPPNGATVRTPDVAKLRASPGARFWPRAAASTCRGCRPAAVRGSRAGIIGTGPTRRAVAHGPRAAAAPGTTPRPAPASRSWDGR